MLVGSLSLESFLDLQHGVKFPLPEGTEGMAQSRESHPSAPTKIRCRVHCQYVLQLVFILGCEPQLCLEESVLGEWIDTIAAFELYVGTEEGEYLLVHPGWRPLETVEEISALTDRHPELIYVPGVIGFGTGLCGGSGEACIHLMLSTTR